jgi:RNA polymerase sigma factor (sigma-70 family)
VTDRQLLAEYRSKASEAAFSEIVRRHLDRVYATCLRVLGDRHEAEDAAQAVFVVLARKAGSLPRNTVLSGWLYLTARNAARDALKKRARRARHEREAAEMKPRQADRPANWEEIRPQLDVALSALSARQRDVVILRYLYGRSQLEAAEELGCSRESVALAATRGLAKLRGRLARRGVAVPAAALGGLLTEKTVSAAPAGLAAAVEAVCLGKAAAPAPVLAIAQGTVKAMSLAKAKLAVVLLASAVAAGTGGGLLARTMLAGGPRFTAGPSAARAGGRVEISFAVDRECDAAVWIEDARGRIVRRISAGALGGNPPAPFVKGLVQSIEWDGTDDAGRALPAEALRGGGCRVKVGLGLGHELERVIGWDPRAIRKVYSVAVGPGGRVYVLWAQPDTVHGSPQVAVLDREGRYLHTVVPYPAELPAASLAAVRPLALPDGMAVPRVHHGLSGTAYPWLAGACRQTMTVTSTGRLVMSSGWFSYGVSASCGPRRLLSVRLDGSCPDRFAGALLDERRVTGYAHLAASPDGRTVYASGLHATDDWAPKRVPCHAVLSAPVGAGPDDRAAVFFGERDKPGAGEARLNDPRGLAVGPEGDVYVADHGNDRIVRLSSSGAFLGAVAVENPDAVALDRRGGAIYVVSVDHGEHGAMAAHGWEDKRILKIRSWADPTVAATIDDFKDRDALTVAVDDEADPSVLWVGSAYQNTYHGSGRGLFRCVDLGDSFGPPECVLGPESGGRGLELCTLIAVDPVGEQLHVRGREAPGRWLVYDGRTGRRLDLPPPEVDGEERAFDRRGRLYCRSAVWRRAKGNYLARFTPDDGRPAPFEGTGRHVIEDLPGFTKSLPRGLCVDGSGRTFILHYTGDPWSRETRSTVTVCGADGQVEREGLLLALDSSLGIRVDRAGNLYVADNIRTRAQPLPPGLGIAPDERKRIIGRRFDLYDHDAWYPFIYGAIVKFGPGGGSIEPGPDEARFAGWPPPRPGAGGVRLAGAEWMRPGVSPLQPAEGEGGISMATRFDLDGFDRIYAPDAGRCRVVVLDANGNRITHFGRYGNFDSAGPGSRLPTPEVPLAWPLCVATSPEAVYVSDWLNARVLRVRPAYAVVGDCPVR